eukprot:GGOE01005585.1.p1 GENE.GGOE01005585.1~~GGOE01005585.1.p1  ORF type:complete len:365 (-),score=83.43 GGOE01005585.1:402-1496(-)
MSAAMERPTVATYTVHETHELPTADNEDHTFCGMMFDVEAKVPTDPAIPVDYIEISAIAVRGDLGPLAVFHTPDTFMLKHEDPTVWVKCYEGRHDPSPDTYQTLCFRESIVLKPGERCGLYVHSETSGDSAIVYDDQRGCNREDVYIRVLPGQAHLSNRPFGRRGPWGTAWRQHREFVGKVSYGIKWLLWNPEVHQRFPAEFQQLVHVMLWAIGQQSSTIAALPEEVILYVMNMCRWDWAPLKKDPRVYQTPAGSGRRVAGWGFGNYVLYHAYDVGSDESEAEDGEEDEDDDMGQQGGMDEDPPEEEEEGEVGMEEEDDTAEGAMDQPALAPWEEAVRERVRGRWGEAPQPQEEMHSESCWLGP